jgi:hypothetical protein
LTTQGLEEGTHFRPWQWCHGRSVFNDHLDEKLTGNLIALGGSRHLPGAWEICEKTNQSVPSRLVRISLVFGKRSKRRSGHGFLLAILPLIEVAFKVELLQSVELSGQPDPVGDYVD